MTIVICGSMTHSKNMLEIASKLREMHHYVILPRHTEEYANREIEMEVHSESVKNKVENDLIRDYYNTIKDCDAVLVVNVDKNGITNYIGGNSFLEMGFAHVLNKPLYLLHEIPQMSYIDEMIAMQPIVLKGDLKKITS